MYDCIKVCMQKLYKLKSFLKSSGFIICLDLYEFKFKPITECVLGLC